jgi:hypothetical protein
MTRDAQGPARTLLARLVQERNWTVEDFRQQYTEVSEAAGRGLTVSERQVMRWFSGQVSGLPYPAACRVLERMFDRPASELLGTKAAGSKPVEGVVDGASLWPARLARMEDFGIRGGGYSDNGAAEMELVMATARESGEHAMFAAAGSLDTSSVEQLGDDVRRLAHAYSTSPPFQLFADLTRTRNTVYALLEQTKRPRQLNDLYTFAGQLCGLLGIASLDLGSFDAGAENARAAWAYGQIVDDDGLRSWARAVQATVAFWSGRPREGVKLTNTGLDYARPGSGEIRLHAVQARSYAAIGAAEEAMAALAAAERAAEANASDELLDDVGGELAFGEERRLLSAAATHLALGQLDQVEHAASQAIDRFAEIPIANRWMPGEYGARIDLIVARTWQGNIEGAEEALAPVLTLPSEQRTGRLAGRLRGLRRSLSQPRYRGSAAVEQLDEQIELFVRESAPVGLLPGVSHHPMLGGGDV